MVGHTMRRALKKLEARRTRERKDGDSASKLAIIDPSHELSQQRQTSSSSVVTQPCMHVMGLQSNPELHTATSNWSSNASVYSFDSASVSSLSTTFSPDNGDLDDDLDMMPYDYHVRAFPQRRRSTGSSRAKSQQKLARILGWNTSFPQWKPPTSSYSSENLRAQASSSKSSSFKKKNPMISEEEPKTPTEHDSMADLKMRQYPARRASSMRETSSKPNAQPYDFQMRQFLSARPYKDNEKVQKSKKLDVDTSHRAESPRSATPTRRNSNPNVHKPLPSTPAFPTFPAIQPLEPQPTMTSSSTPTTSSRHSPSFELSAEEASILLSQPEPTELSSEPSTERAELPDPSTTNMDGDSVTRIRSKSPTHARNNSATSQVHDFGPGTTLSIIEEEPFDAEDLAKLKVFELAAEDIPEEPLVSAVSGGMGDSCPGLSPSSSLSSRRLRLKEEESEESLESKADKGMTSESKRTDSSGETGSQLTTEDAEGEGEEIIVIFDRRSNVDSTDMSGKTFLTLDDDDSDDATDTEESYRNSIQSESRYTAQALRPDLYASDSDEDDNVMGYRRSTSAETTKTAYTTSTTSTTKTLVGHEQDFSRDLAKQMDWL